MAYESYIIPQDQIKNVYSYLSSQSLVKSNGCIIASGKDSYSSKFSVYHLKTGLLSRSVVVKFEEDNGEIQSTPAPNALHEFSPF